MPVRARNLDGEQLLPDCLATTALALERTRSCVERSLLSPASFSPLLTWVVTCGGGAVPETLDPAFHWSAV